MVIDYILSNFLLMQIFYSGLEHNQKAKINLMKLTLKS
jgi:hypothetical protein